MLDTPEIVHTVAQIAAVIRITVPRDQIQEVMGPAIMEVIEAANAQGIGPIGPVFSHHFNMQPDIFNLEVGVPVFAEVKPVGRVRASELPAVRVMRTVYTGPYQRLGDAWRDFMDYIEAAGQRPAANLWERYLSDPERDPDPATYRTELNRPIL